VSKKGAFYLFITLFFLNLSGIISQTIQKEKQPLITVLKILETRYNISFSYADESIKEKLTKIPSIELSLSDALETLKETTDLDFEILDSRFVTIKKLFKSETRKLEQLPELILTNYLTSGITKSNYGTINLKPSRFGILPGLIEPDVLQTVQALPGVLSVDETISNINIRGGTHDQNLLLWDGIKMYQSGHFFGLISAFNPYLTERVNVSKNGTSAKYGDGISSVIDMQLSNNIDNVFKAGIGLNLINVDGYAKIPLSEKVEFQLSSRRSVTDLIITPTYDQYFKRIFQDSDLTNNQNSEGSGISKNERFYFYDVTAKLLYNITEKDKLRVSFLNVYNNLNYEEQSIINDRTEALNSKLTQRNLATGISYSRTWNEQLKTTAQIYLSNYDLDATNFDVINNQRLIQENEVYDGAVKLNMEYKFNGNFKFNSGYQFFEVGISNLEDVNNPDFRSYIKEVIRSQSVYAEGDFLSDNANTNFRFGLRLNYIKKLNTYLFEPRLSFNQRFLNNFRFELLAEYKSQTTSQIIDLQNDFLGVEKRRWILSNNNEVPIIKSKQASLGIHYSKNNLLISAEGYIKDVNGITTRSQGFQNQYQFVNAIGNYQVKGIDVLINKQFKNASTWLSYSFAKNDYTFDTLNGGEPFPNNVDVRHKLTFAGTYTYNSLKLALGLNWHSGKPLTLPEESNDVLNSTIIYQNPNAHNLDDYLRTDFSATYEFSFSDTTKATIGASVWNLLNKKNSINTYYTLNDEDIINKVENLSLGITPNMSLRLHF
jgi:hypothetical protein